MTETERDLLVAIAEAICAANEEPRHAHDPYVMVRIYLKQLKAETKEV